MKRKIQDILQQKPWLGYAFMLAIGFDFGLLFSFLIQVKKRVISIQKQAKTRCIPALCTPKLNKISPENAPFAVWI